MKRTYKLFRGKVSKLGKNMAYTGTPAGKHHGTCIYHLEIHCWQH